MRRTTRRRTKRRMQRWTRKRERRTLMRKTHASGQAGLRRTGRAVAFPHPLQVTLTTQRRRPRLHHHQKKYVAILRCGIQARQTEFYGYGHHGRKNNMYIHHSYCFHCFKRSTTGDALALRSPLPANLFRPVLSAWTLMDPLRENKLFDIRLFGAARSRAGSQNLRFQKTSLLSSRFGIAFLSP
jgi:hypothetical protein